MKNIKTTPYTQQDLTFKIADILDHLMDIKYINTDVIINAYSLEAIISSTIETLGLQLTITDMTKFECGTNETDELPF